MAGCQPNSGTDKVEADSATVADNADGLDTEVTPMSEAAETQVANFEAEFVNRMLDLQQSQLAEYEALQAADSPEDSAENSEPEQATTGTDNTVDLNADLDSETGNTAQANLANSEQVDAQPAATAANQTDAEPSDSAKTGSESPLSSLQLPLIHIALKPPEELTAVEISNRYNVALQSLYLEDEVSLPPQAVETLLNIANLTPQVFDNPELAERLVVKAPALARLLKQYQTWEQQFLQQKREVESLKQQQQQEQQQQAAKFDQLTQDLNDKIKDYDQQIELSKKKLESLE